ncbi:hypothetical protein CcaverHIS002_0110250 [Cutaneotrichosporon cavernicola]|uniref:Uncharacterized protein n=1 Tax=Cutaneotrichosporon cavernicola TaxID=279322 RepID=A0AA48I5N2_9TREE|nr:uncharacterized protein CcaverHIS019_0110180 [Cutaneotrichosporon cavernicola]BEI80496.1 hypothetical protein CcaverHIS002_0110250 [Cutaneotrichosporon cavernicola]BEI88300.1 hypothetical protein CcaverHIS019_0110180 [Cutaneotrichosporon cavernicola]BEI96072.1 hypothetical protein CcaverHIS631_0110210 [Cutaneotrichosporon cavernicola]BEJ03845.1 hypothetical protein CcaverHIS641_0110200 [Cutaneotrichosporon cavernicola]
MTDHGRRDLSDKIAAKLKPESRKTVAESTGDKVAGKLDAAASRMQPQHHKSVGQKISDAFTRDTSNRRVV